MSLITKITDVVFTNTDLPVLRRDAVINDGTQFLYDALNPVSWPQQTAPALGTPSADKWLNLTDLSDDGVFKSGGIAWGASGGFVSNDGPSDKIFALDEAVPLVLTKLLAVTWFKHVAGGANITSLISMFGDMLGLAHTNAINGGVPADRIYAFSNASAAREVIGIGDTSLIAGNIYQVGLFWDNAIQRMEFFVNGVSTGDAAGYRDLQTPTRPYSLMQASGYASDYEGVFYRWFADDLSGDLTPAEIVALDYELNSNRFA